MATAGAAVYIYIASAVAAVGSAVYSGVTAHQQAKVQAKLAENDARVQQQNALLAQQAAERERNQVRRKAMAVSGQQASDISASGMTLEFSGADILTSTQIDAEDDMAMALYRGNLNARNFNLESTSALDRASMYRAAGNSALVSGFMSAAGSAMQGYGGYKMATAKAPSTGSSWGTSSGASVGTSTGSPGMGGSLKW